MYANHTIDEYTYQNKLKRVDQPIFPGSQPVSLSYANEALIYEKRYAGLYLLATHLHARRQALALCADKVSRQDFSEY
jgi:hypothetical protein